MSNLERAIAKCKHRVRNAWYAYLTPSEFLALLDNGATPEHPSDLFWVKESIASGDSAPRWKYFRIGRKIQAMLPSPKYKRVGTREKR